MWKGLFTCVGRKKWQRQQRYGGDGENVLLVQGN
jgi:hypothetical protein